MFGNLFGGKSRRARKQAVAEVSKYSEAVQQIYFYTGNYERVNPIDNINQIAKYAYRNPAVSFAVDSIADDCCGLPLKARVRGGDEKPFVWGERDFDIVRGLLRPTVLHSRHRQEGYALRDLLMFGVCFQHGVVINGILRETWRLPPSRMTVIEGNHGMPQAFEVGGITGWKNSSGYRWQVNSATGHCEIFYSKTYHPTDIQRAIAAVQKCYREVNASSEIAEINYNIAKNAGVPSGVFRSTSDRPIVAEELSRMRDEVKDKFQGARNAGKPFFAGNLEWQPIGMTSREGEFVQTRDAMLRDILAQYRVPPQLYGLPDNATYSNYSEARRAYFLRAVLPVAEAFWADRSLWVSNLLGEDIEIMPDTNRMPVIADWTADRMQKIEAVNFLTINEKREMAGLKSIGADGDTVLVPAGMGNISDAVNPPEPPDFDPFGDGDEPPAKAPAKDSDKEKTPPEKSKEKEKSPTATGGVGNKEKA